MELQLINNIELIMLIPGIGVLALTLIYKAEIKRILGWSNLITAFYLLLAAWIFTNAEAFLWTWYLFWLPFRELWLYCSQGRKPQSFRSFRFFRFVYPVKQ
jgi:hypothetical protein